jgi:protein phosphatase
LVHVGDSRCYLLRERKLHQVTKDHTVAQNLIDEGTLGEEEAARSQWLNVLWNAIGRGAEELRPELMTIELELGDVLLLCSDGLTKHVADGEIARLLALPESEETTCRRLVAAANDAGGSDNVTVVVARFPRAARAPATARPAADPR